MTHRWIVAMGGGGFTMEDGDSKLDAFVVELARERRGRALPRLGWIGTAGADSLDTWLRCQAAFAGKAECSRLGLFERTIEDLDAWVLDQDAIYVGGGNTASMLAVWRAHGVDAALVRAHEAGVVLSGLSAGAICWFESGTTDSFGPRLRVLHGGLGLLSGSFTPHYHGEAQRRPTTHAVVADGTLPGGWAVDDEAAVVYDGTTFVETVATRSGPRAFRVERAADGSVLETALDPRPL